MHIQLADGYNGTKALFDDNPIAIDGNLVKLQCAEAGKEYMTAWKHKNDVIAAVKAALPSDEFFAWLKAKEMCTCGHMRSQHPQLHQDPANSRRGVCIECRCNEFSAGTL